MAVIEIAKIQVRRGQENQTGLPTLAGGEFAWAADTEHLYIGLRREDGGSRDANVRILTENDERNFFNVMATDLKSLGWNNAARAAKLHSTSRLHAASLIPACIRRGKNPWSLVKHLFAWS